MTSASSPFIKAKGWERFVVYDATGTVYGDAFEAGLTVLLDGQIVAHAEELAPLLVDLA